MHEILERAKQAASLLWDDVESASHVETHDTGVSVVAVARRSGERATVTLNPNGLGAGVEWSTPSGTTGYRTFRLQGLVPAQEEKNP